MSIHRIPNVDFSKIPGELQGLWVVVRVGTPDQEVLGKGETPGEAMNGIDRDDLSAVLTRVPVPTAVAYMGTTDTNDE